MSMYDFKPQNKSQTIVAVYYGGVYLGRLMAERMSRKEIKRGKKQRFTIVDKDMLEVTPGSPLYRKLSEPMNRHQAAEAMRMHRRARRVQAA